MSPRRLRHAVLAASLGVATLALVRTGPPAPAGLEVPPEEFSAARAREELVQLLGDERPHPVGSAADAAVRERLVARLRALGLQPEEQRAFACSEGGNCAPVTNVIAWLPGQVPGPALALTSHYDSVGAGPGAADDGHGVATTLELLRILLPLPRRPPLMAVFTDGEEAGLLGMRAFAEHPRAREIGVALNLEARGTTGAARMFETSDGNAALIAAYAAARPSALSLSYEIYRRLPNDTDLTVLKGHGLQGMNFAFIGGVLRYHTPRDDLAHLDLGSVQQQGDAVLATARNLLAADLPPPAPHNAHYVDLLGLVLLRWPAWLDLPLAAAALLALLVTAVRRRRELSARTVLLALAAPFVAVLAAVAAATVLLLAAESLTSPLGPWRAATGTALLGLAAAALAAALAAARPLVRRAGPLAQSLVTWLLWTGLGLLLATQIPGAAILLLAPAVLAAVAPASRLAPIAAALLATAVWAPLAPALVEALGLSAPLVGATVGWLCTALLPACPEEPGEKTLPLWTWSFALVALLATTFAAVAPRHDVDHPSKANLIHLTDLDAGRAWHVVEAPSGVPEPLAAALAWDEPRALLPWSSRAVPSAPATVISDAGPTLELRPPAAGDPPGRATMTLRARPGALASMLVIPAGAVNTLRVGGRDLDVTALRPGPSDTRVVTVFGCPAEGVEVVADITTAAPWIVVDLAPGLAPDAPASARPEWAVPYQWGDVIAARRSFTPPAGQ
ncbi:Peptidase family M28 [Nannocystis exedens]|uniref:Peptidase family M28 n=1 Tax=Nannocystis exedens TaxID=54 RepID=A0A1I2FJD5_9BACT|nr:M28 family peptidase [Nannocystis exedens]PCC70420.1 peptidase [Nannocystis exedens]SFF04571.1 Peptidase family M28 [Nannocystis exedens]